VGIKFAIVAGRATAATGNLSAARSALETTLKNEIKMGFLAYQLETRVALAEIEIMSGQLKIGRAHLAAAAAEAKAKGYNLVARKASIVRAG
jgi:methylphosphotriester-DNA--protein-cysteine methyltransferase